MHIKLINKNLYFDDYKLKCAIGKRGITSKKGKEIKKLQKVPLNLFHCFIEKIE